MEAALQLLLCGWFVGISSKPICINTVRISVFTCSLRVMNPKGPKAYTGLQNHDLRAV